MQSQRKEQKKKGTIKIPASNEQNGSEHTAIINWLKYKWAKYASPNRLNEWIKKSKSCLEDTHLRSEDTQTEREVNGKSIYSTQIETCSNKSYIRQNRL